MLPMHVGHTSVPLCRVGGGSASVQRSTESWNVKAGGRKTVTAITLMMIIMAGTALSTFILCMCIPHDNIVNGNPI